MVKTKQKTAISAFSCVWTAAVGHSGQNIPLPAKGLECFVSNLNLGCISLKRPSKCEALSSPKVHPTSLAQRVLVV